jgi:hypothetical protein
MRMPFCFHKSNPNILVYALDEKSAIFAVPLKEMNQNVLFSTVLMVFRGGDCCNTTTALKCFGHRSTKQSTHKPTTERVREVLWLVNSTGICGIYHAAFNSAYKIGT